MSDAQRLPNLYQLLGLNGSENNLDKISAALQRAQEKIDAIKSDSSRASDVARLQKVIALSQKYLLNPALKASYDAQWKAIYGAESSSTSKAANSKPASNEVAAKGATAKGATAKVAAANEAPLQSSTKAFTVVSVGSAATIADELTWDMSSLDSLLPDADPLAPFQMVDYLRTSEVRDPLAAEADLRKLITLLGGEYLPESQPDHQPIAQPITHPISMQQIWSDEPVEPNRGGQLALADDAFDEPEQQAVDTGIVMPRAANSSAGVGLAKRMRQKKQRALLMGGVGLLGAMGALVVLGLYLNRPVKPSAEVAQVPVPKPQVRSSLPTVTKPDPSGDKQPEAAASQMPGGLIQPGGDLKPLEIQAPQMAKPDAVPDAVAKPEKPAEPMKPLEIKPVEPDKSTEPMKPADATKPDATKPDANPDAANPDAAKPDTKPDMKPVAPVKLSDKEKKAWQEEMKRVRAALNKLDPAASEKQIAELTPSAKTPEQKSQLATLEQAVSFIRKAREAIVAGITGLESGETFKVGNSTELAFVEGDETHIVVRNGGRRQDYKIEAIPVAMGLVLMKLKPNVVDVKLEASMGIYIMVQTKVVAAKTAEGKKLLEDAVAAGAISKELSEFYSEDFKVQ